MKIPGMEPYHKSTVQGLRSHFTTRNTHTLYPKTSTPTISCVTRFPQYPPPLSEYSSSGQRRGLVRGSGLSGVDSLCGGQPTLPTALPLLCPSGLGRNQLQLPTVCAPRRERKSQESGLSLARFISKLCILSMHLFTQVCSNQGDREAGN